MKVLRRRFKRRLTFYLSSTLDTNFYKITIRTPINSREHNVQKLFRKHRLGYLKNVYFWYQIVA